MAELTRSTIQSEAAFIKARQVMPGGVSSPVRAFQAVGGMPLFIKQAEGCIVTDLDENRYVDYVGSYGPMIVGHANERVVAALSKAIGRGTSYGAPTEAEATLAEKILSAYRFIRTAPARQARRPEKWDGHAAERIAHIIAAWRR